jgi:Flp pilus assembly protein TadD
MTLAPLRRPWAALLLMLLLLGGERAMAATAPEGPAREIELQFRGGDTAGAMQRLDQALASRPGDARLRFLQGVMLSEAGRPAEAAAVFERMTEEFPDLPEPYNNLAVLQAASGQFDRARSLLETALRLDPAYRTAHENLGDVLIRLAQRAYETAADGPRVEPLLKTKLRLVRELIDAR